MYTNVKLLESNSGGESAMPTEAVPQIETDIQSDKENMNGKTVTNDSAQSKRTLVITDEILLQVTNVISGNAEHPSQVLGIGKSKSCSKVSDRVRRKSWYNVIYPSYKSRSETFKKLFKEIPNDQRLIVDYSCALQREILVHGRMFVSQNYMCFHANIFGWETYLTLKWKNVTAMTKEKTALVFSNAILITTETDKYFMTSFAARDKTYLMLYRIWQNALMNKSMMPHEVWQCVHNVYGEQLGLTSDDEDYIDPKNEDSLNLLEKSSDDVIPKPSNISETETAQPNETPIKMPAIETMNDIPSDVSISTESEEEHNVPFECTAECTSLHEGRQLLHSILPINIESLLTMLFSKSKFFAEFHNARKTTNMVYRDWLDNGDGTKTRTLNFTVAITQAVGPKSSNVTEVQVMRDCSVPGQLYSIDTTATNAGIPYADSFHTMAHYCLKRTVDDQTMLSVYAQIKYTKSVWGVIKGFIEKNAWAGLENFFADLLKALQTEYYIPPEKTKSRHVKKTASQKLSTEEALSKELPLKSTIEFKEDVSSQLEDVKALTSTSNENIVSATCLAESTPDQNDERNYLTFNMFSMFIVIMIVTLFMLNIYLLGQLYVLKYEQPDGIPLDQVLLDRLNGDPNEMRQNWLELLNHQKVMHESELVKWQSFVKSTVNLLQNIKEIYSNFNLDLQNVENSVKEEF